MEQTELAVLTSNSVGTPKPMLWERRAPARQKTMIMCKSGGPHTHAASTYSITDVAVHYFYYLVSTNSSEELNCSFFGKSNSKIFRLSGYIHAKATDSHYHA